MSPVELGQAGGPPVGGRRGVHDEQLGAGPVDEPGADVDERVQHLGDAAPAALGVDQGVGLGAGQARARAPRRRGRRRSPDRRPPPAG